MDNDLFKSIVEQFPSVALLIGCVGAFVWLIKNLMEIKSKNYVSKLNKEVLEITLSSVKSKELIEGLNRLQEIVSELEQFSKHVSDKVFLSEIEYIKNKLVNLRNELPDDWKYRNELAVDANWLINFSNISKSVNTISEGDTGKAEKDFCLLIEDFSKKTENVFFAIDELIKLTTRYKDKAESTINWIATAKGAGALCLLISFSFGLVSYEKIHNKLSENSFELASLAKNQEVKMAIVKNELNSTKHQLNLAEKTVANLKQNLASARSEEDLANSLLASVGKTINGLSRTMRDIRDSNPELKGLINEFEALASAVSNSEEKEKSDKDSLGVQIRLKWEEPADLDLMIKLPSGEKVNFQNRHINESKTRLVEDILTGPAEEIIFVHEPSSGDYEISVSNYSKKGFITFEVLRIIDGDIVSVEKGTVNKNAKVYKFKLK